MSGNYADTLKGSEPVHSIVQNFLNLKLTFGTNDLPKCSVNVPQLPAWHLSIIVIQLPTTRKTNCVDAQILCGKHQFQISNLSFVFVFCVGAQT